MSNTFGEYLRITTWGESHGPGIGVVLDGLPAGLPVTPELLQQQLKRRRPGGDLASPRKEPDEPMILSGVYEGKTLGTPVSIYIESSDVRSSDYDSISEIYRPGHADFTTEARYGHRDPRGGGRASARETAARVAAGAIAAEFLRLEHGIEIVGWVSELAGTRAPVEIEKITREEVDSSLVRCPHEDTSSEFVAAVSQARDEGESLGGWVGVVARGVPAGWGDPVFGKLKAWIGQAMLSIPATVAIEIGDGIAATGKTGGENNDAFGLTEEGEIAPATNRSGGLLGGISSGAPIWLRVGFKPTSTIRRSQKSVKKSGEEVQFSGTGRHDPCVLPRAVPIVESMLALVLADRFLSRRALPPFEGNE
ncbi:chorismate synthase [bacterium TMED181]|nr:chorismate synthase [Planctomycetota bacterium]OUW43751.1 MAG: chorismate synthase [bacterium TMED181]